MSKKKENVHKGCPYEAFCTKEEKWCPYVQNGRYTCNEYKDNYIFK